MVVLSNENPLYDIDGLPFFATSYDAARKLADLQRPYIEKILDGQGLKLLYAVPWPPQGLQVNKEINSVADMAGLNFRAYSKQTARIGELVKANPVTIQAAEVTQALATGKINSMISSAQSSVGYQSGVDYKIWESLSHFYDLQGWLPSPRDRVRPAQSHENGALGAESPDELASPALGQGGKSRAECARMLAP